RGLAFPYYSQEAPGSSDGLPDGLAGEFAKRRLMRGGMAGTLPRAHQGLGVSMYAQVTSPLRRYGDLLAHQQIRAALELSGAAPLPPDELSMRLARAQAGAQALRKAERNSELHWSLAWLIKHPDWTGTGIVVQSGQDSLVYLSQLGMETRIKGHYELNEEKAMRFLKADLARLEAAFSSDS
ncbi:MAG TPA: RNB domain-containing ribonuclease, partial [Spirochaetales bacterium]|nr:RNB domain-containing ribonuclease [Spirochaetales bacterium]